MITHTSDQASDRRTIPPGTRCFFCGRGIEGTVIAWWGSGSDVHLHPKCTVELAIRLLRDVHEVEHSERTSITGGPPVPDPRWG